MRTLGIQIDGPILRAAVVEIERKKVKIRDLRSAPMSDPQNVKQLYIPSFAGRIASGISSNKVMIRHLDLKIPPSRYLEEALLFQTETVTHFKLEDVISVPQIIGQTGEKTEAILYIVPREAIRDILRDLEKLSVDPDGISANQLALLHYADWKDPLLEEALLIHLGHKEWSCVLMEKGRVKKSHTILGGNQELLLALWEDRKKILLHKEVEGVAKQIDLLQLKANLNPHLSKRLHEMKLELAQTIYSFHRNKEPLPYFFTGCIDTFVHYREYLRESFNDVAAAPLEWEVSLEESKYAIPIGLAIEQSKKKPLQLRREEFFPRKNWRRSGFYALGLIFISITLSMSLIVIGKKILSSRKAAMIEELGLILEKNDPELKRKLFSESETNILYDWVNAVDLYSKDYPYIPQVPKVAEVLSWLTSYPLFEKLKMEKTPILIRDFSYQLVQYPRIGSLEEPYRAKVEIEFETESPMSARKFHQALLKGDDFIDPRQEIGWEALSHGYRASFFLKTRRPYVL